MARRDQARAPCPHRGVRSLQSRSGADSQAAAGIESCCLPLTEGERRRWPVATSDRHAPVPLAEA
jgi:hypothetical protein